MKKDFLKKLYEEAVEFGDITNSIVKFCKEYKEYEILLEVIDGEIYQDSDFDEFINAIGYWSVGYINREDLVDVHKELKCSSEYNYLIISNKENMFLIPYREEENRFDETCSDEILYYFEGMVYVPKDNIEKCDMCSRRIPKPVLINLHPDINLSDLNLNKEYDGMICPRCYNKMC